MFNLKKGQGIIFIINLLYLIPFFIIFLNRRNYEFVSYVGVIIIILAIILLTNKKVNYPNIVLWGLTLWGLMHMAGGGIRFENGNILYKLILIPISASYEILKYDQVVHLIGFGVATLLAFALVKPLLKEKLSHHVALGIVVVMAGLGIGALNEIVEFTVTVFVPETGVGGYVNTSLDLVADLVGGLIAWIWIVLKKYKI